MLYKTNILAMTGGGKNPKYNPNKVILWDEYQTKVLYEFKFTSNIKNIKLKKDKIFIVCEQKIYVYSLDKDYKIIEIIETCDNVKGVIGINSEALNTIIAYPVNPIGFVMIKNYEKSKSLTIKPYDNNISYISINSNGTLISISSNEGRLIRIFTILKGEFIEEFRRGKEKAEIDFICFDPFNNFMGVSSDRGTIHIWSLGNTWKIIKDKNIDIEKKEEILPENHQSFLKILPGFITGGIFNSDKSFAQIRLNDEKCIFSFGPENIIVVVSSNGKYYQSKFNDKKGGDCDIIYEESLYN